MNRSKAASAPLTLDRTNECVHQGDHPVKLTPKAFAVLRHLMERQGRLATKDDLLAAVWGDTAVTEASLATCIREIRRALNDDPATPRYIQTVHRRGYRYVGATLHAADMVEMPRTNLRGAQLVGRDRELASLERSLRQVEGGEPRLMFVGGEAGIGKTALVEHFLEETARRARAHVARGQCVEQYGACEAYLPWFDVLNQLARDYGRERLVAVLRQCAPMWLAQIPWLTDASERKQLWQETAGTTRERMVRELAEALEALSADQPLVVALEDLHWSDPSSIGVVAYLARRQRPRRLLLLGTYRPADLHVSSHPLMALKQELLLHGACDDLSLDFLPREAVAEYVRSRLPGVPDDLATQVYRRTDGNPLFIVNVIDYLVARGALFQEEEGRWHVSATAQAAQTDVPENLKEMIERQLDRLSEEDRLALEAASVAGATFSAASVAAALEESVESAEDRLSALARRGAFVRGTHRQIWPDGTESDAYAFIHVLYQNVLYDRISTTRRSRIHRRAGERLEAGYGDRAAELAAELALHFQRGHDPARAVGYLAQAGENAMQRSAYVEAIALFNEGIELLSRLPEGAERDACELRLRVPLGFSYVNTRGNAAPEVGTTFERAHKLCRQVSDTARLFRVLRGLWSFATLRANLRGSRSVARALLHAAKRERNSAGLVEGHRIMATTRFHLGNFSCALSHVERGLALYDPVQYSSHALLYGQDLGAVCHAWHAWTQWYLGWPDRAVTSALRSIELARQLGHPYSLSYAMNFAAHLHLCRGEPAVAEDYAREAVRHAQEQGLASMLAMGQVLHGWSEALLGRADAAIGELEDGVARWRSTGALLMTPYLMSLRASALNALGRTAEAIGVLNDALAMAECSDERWFECELYILKASLTARTCDGHARRDPCAQARHDLRRAHDAATRMASPSLRLRAANALGRVLCEQGQSRDARDLIGSAYAAFKEGFQTADLIEARAMLAKL